MISYKLNSKSFGTIFKQKRKTIVEDHHSKIPNHLKILRVKLQIVINGVEKKNVDERKSLTCLVTTVNFPARHISYLHITNALYCKNSDIK